MKQFLFSALVLFYVAHSITLAQVLSVDRDIVTFDKLTKTVIPFTASAKPTVTIEPRLSEPRLEGRYTVEYTNGKGTLTITKPVAAGTYIITISAGGDTAYSTWKVLPSQLDEKSMRYQIWVQYSYGKRVYLKSKLPSAAVAVLPLEQFTIEYTLGIEPAVTGIPYIENYIGPYVPANARKVKIQVVWKYPTTNERVPLMIREVEPAQQAPDINATNAVASLKNDPLPAVPNGFQIAIQGIRVEYQESPVDADNSDPKNSKPVYATLDMVQPVGEAQIMYSAQYTQLHIYDGDNPDPVSPWMPNEKTFFIVNGAYSEGTFPLTIQVRNLPPCPRTESRTLRGTIVIDVKAKIVNKKIGRSSFLSSEPVTIPINISYQADSAGMLVTAEPPSQKQPAPKPFASSLCKDCSDAMVQYPIWRVTSPALREQVQAHLLQLGRKLPTTPLNAKIPLMLEATARRNDTYELATLRFGNEVLTRREIRETMMQGCIDILAEPITAQGNKGYRYEVLSAKEQEQERKLMQNLAHNAGYYEGATILRKFDYYSHAGYAIYQADSAAVLRFREELTPSITRTPTLEEAERECSTAEAIKQKILKKQSIPQSLIDETPNACDMVRNYYKAESELSRIDSVFILTKKTAGGSVPEIVSAVSISMLNSAQITNVSSIKAALNAPLSIGMLDTADLRQFTTHVYEESHGTQIHVKGSIAGTSFTNLYDYCLDGIRKGTFADRTAELMPFPAETFKASINAKKPPSAPPSKPIAANVTRQTTNTQTLLQTSFGTPDLRSDLTGWAVCDAALTKEIRGAIAKAANVASNRSGAVTIFGNQYMNGVFDLHWMICGTSVLSKTQIDSALPATLRNRIAKPFERILLKDDKDTTINLYCHTMLSPLEQCNTLTYASTQISKQASMRHRSVPFASATEALMHLADYAYNNISLFEANADAIRRFREELTPSITKTAAIEAAEQDCPTTDKIRIAFKNKQNIPQSLIDEAPNECEMVRNYYKRIVELAQIGKVFVVTTKLTNASNPAITIIGTVSIPIINPTQASNPEALKIALHSPISAGVLDANDLKRFRTKVIERSTDPNNPGMIYVRGSIETAPDQTMDEYFQTMIQQNPRDIIYALRRSDWTEMPPDTIMYEYVKTMVRRNPADAIYMQGGKGLGRIELLRAQVRKELTIK